MNFAATFQDQFSPLAPFALYLLIWVLVFIETGILIHFMTIINQILNLTVEKNAFKEEETQKISNL